MKRRNYLLLHRFPFLTILVVLLLSTGIGWAQEEPDLPDPIIPIFDLSGSDINPPFAEPDLPPPEIPLIDMSNSLPVTPTPDRLGTHYAEPLDYTYATTDLARDLAIAIDIPADLIINVSLGTSDVRGGAVFSGSMASFPIMGGNFAVLSTGQAADASRPNNEGGLTTKLDGLNTIAGTDLVQLTVTIKVPDGANVWSIDWKFFSEEYKEYVGKTFNDAFFVETPVSSIDISGADVSTPYNVAIMPDGKPATINAAGVLGMTEANASGTTYDGATETVTTALIASGTPTLTLIFSIMDIGDSVYDTAVFLDNFQFDTLELPEPSWKEKIMNLLDQGQSLFKGWGTFVQEQMPGIRLASNASAGVLLVVNCVILINPPLCAGTAIGVGLEMIAIGFIDWSTKKLADDPPDYNYAEVYPLREPHTFDPADASALSVAHAAYLTELDKQGAIYEAFVISFERLQGAVLNEVPQYILLQSEAVEDYLEMLNQSQADFADTSRNFATEFELYFDSLDQTTLGTLEQLIQTGLGDDQKQQLKDVVGLTDEEIADINEIIVGSTYSPDLGSQVAEILNDWADVAEDTIAVESAAARDEFTDFVTLLDDTLNPESNVAPAFDAPPSPTMGSEFTVNAGSEFTLSFQASDADVGDTVSIVAVDVPEDAVFTPVSGSPATADLTWTPAKGEAGIHILSFIALDNHNATSTPLSVVLVINANNPPEITNPGDQTNNEGEKSVTLQIIANDPDDDLLTFSAVGLPENLSIEPSTGLISGGIDRYAGLSTAYVVTVTATDNGTPAKSSSIEFDWYINNVPTTLQLMAPDAYISNSHGRPVYVWPDIPDVTGIEVYMAPSNDFLSTKFWGTLYSSQYCDGALCSADLASIDARAWLPNGQYTVYMNPRPGVIAGWILTPFRFNVSEPAPNSVQTHEVINYNDKAVLSWSLNGTAEYSAWYQLYVAPSDDLARYQIYTWISRDEYCDGWDGTECIVVLTPRTQLANRQFSWYVQSWGPGGLSVGGIAGWAVGQPFTFNQ